MTTYCLELVPTEESISIYTTESYSQAVSQIPKYEDIHNSCEAISMAIDGEQIIGQKLSNQRLIVSRKII